MFIVNLTIFLTTLNFEEQESDKFMQMFIQQGGCNNRILDFPSSPELFKGKHFPIPSDKLIFKPHGHKPKYYLEICKQW